MNRKTLFMILALVAIVVGIGSKGSTDRQRAPKPTGDLGRTAAELESLLSELETLLDSPPWNQTSIQAVSVNGEEINRIETVNGKIRRTVSRTRRFDESTR